jgi:hypothetical protein
MKKTGANWKSFSILLITLGVILAGCVEEETLVPASTITPKYTLSDAIENNSIRAKTNGNGASSGDSISLEITSLTSQTIEITVPKGTVLFASDGSQNMVIRKVRGIAKDSERIIPVSKIVLDSSETQIFILEAYCMNFHKKNPSSETEFAFGTLADPNILKILNALDNLSSDITSIGAIQTAIWIVTDDISMKELEDRFPIEQKDIDNAKVILEEAGINMTSKRRS